MPVESLFQKSFSDIPQRDCLISPSRSKYVWTPGKLHIVNWIGMASESLPHFLLWDIEEFAGWVHWARYDEITSVVERDCSDWVNMGIESCNTGGFEEVPNFDSRIARAGGQVRPLGMEIEISHPILVALPRHYQLPVRQCSYLPGLIVTRGSNNRFLRMHWQRCNSALVSFEPLCLD